MNLFGQARFGHNLAGPSGPGGTRVTGIRRQSMAADSPARITGIRRQSMAADSPARITGIRRQVIYSAVSSAAPPLPSTFIGTWQAGIGGGVL